MNSAQVKYTTKKHSSNNAFIATLDKPTTDPVLLTNINFNNEDCKTHLNVLIATASAFQSITLDLKLE